MQTTYQRNGYSIRYSKRHDNWVIKREGQTIQEFAFCKDALEWAEAQTPRAKDLALRILDVVKAEISKDTYNECLYIINNN